MERIDVNPTVASPLTETTLRALYSQESILRRQELFDLFLERAQSPSCRQNQQPTIDNPPTTPTVSKSSETNYCERPSTTKPPGGPSSAESSESTPARPAKDESNRHDPLRESSSLSQSYDENSDADRDSASRKSREASAASVQGQNSPSVVAPGNIPAQVVTTADASAGDASPKKNILTAESGGKNPHCSEKEDQKKSATDLLQTAASSPLHENETGDSRKSRREAPKVSASEPASPGDGQIGTPSIKAGGGGAGRPAAQQAEHKTFPAETRNTGKNPSRQAMAASIAVVPTEAVASTPAINQATVVVPQAAFASVPQNESVVQSGSPATDSATLDSPFTGVARQGAKSAVQVSGKAGKSGGGEQNMTMDRVRFVQRVEQAFAAVGNRGGSIRLKLSPPELGSLRLEITVRKGTLKARVEAETLAAKNLLLENLSQLRDRLAQQNVQVQQFDVELMDRGLGGSLEQRAPHADSGGSQDGYRPPGGNAAENAADTATPAIARRWPGDEAQLNVLV
jgi:flagellar hook-length control protein FliK